MYFSSDSSEDEFSLLSSQSPSSFVAERQSRAVKREIYSLIKKKNYTSALTLLNETLVVNADDIKLLSLRSKCYSKLAMSAEANLDAKKSYDLLITQEVTKNKRKGMLLCKVYCNLAKTQINANKFKEAFRTLTNARRHNEILSMEPGVSTSFMMNNSVAIKDLFRIIREKEKQDEKDEINSFLGDYKERYKKPSKSKHNETYNSNHKVVTGPTAKGMIKSSFPYYDPKGLTRLELVQEAIQEKHQLNTLIDNKLNPFESYINLIGSRAKVEKHSNIPNDAAVSQGSSKGVRFASEFY